MLKCMDKKPEDFCMTYKIIGDSCLDLTDELKKDSRFQMIPLTLQVGTATVVDDETFNQKKFIDMVKACPECPKTACPSPETFKEAYEAADAEGVFVITLSGHLSGSYNSAALAKKLYEEGIALRSIGSHLERRGGDSPSGTFHRLLNGVRSVGCRNLVHRMLERPAQKRGRIHIDKRRDVVRQTSQKQCDVPALANEMLERIDENRKLIGLCRCLVDGDEKT